MFELLTDKIDSDQLKSDLKSDQAGALVVFEGIVRDHNDGKKVISLEYEAHPPLCHSEIQKIYKEAQEKFNIIAFKSVHRIGHLQIGDIAVWVGVIATHRDDAFKAGRYLIDEIKARLPIWKKEHYATGASEWINCNEEASAKLIRETQYYARQMQLKDVGLSGQEMLKTARVLVIGAGGLGSSCLLELAGAGIGTIGVCEFDTLEVSNLHRQYLYSHQDIGKPKADLAIERINSLNPFIYTVKHSEAITADNVLDIIKDYDYVCDCTDNFKTKFIIHDACFFLHKTLLQASIYQYEGQLSVYSSEMPGCMRCLWPDVPEAGCVGTCTEAGVIGVIPSFFGTIQACEVIKMILTFEQSLYGQTLFYNCVDHSQRIIQNTISSHCPLCGDKPRIKYMDKNNYSSNSAEAIDVDALADYDLSRCIFLDIREQNEIDNISVDLDNVEYMPLSEFNGNNFDFKDDKQYIIFCAAGVRSLGLVRHLHEKGLMNTVSLNQGVYGLYDYAQKTEMR